MRLPSGAITVLDAANMRKCAQVVMQQAGPPAPAKRWVHGSAEYAHINRVKGRPTCFDHFD